MWRTLRRGIVALAVALAMLLSGAAQPAHANADGASKNVTDLALLAYQVFKARGFTAEQIAQFVQLVLGAVSATDNAIRDHIDGLEASEVLGHLRRVSYEMSEYQVMRENEIWRETYPWTVAGFATNAFEKYHAVQSRVAKDQIGLAGQSLYSTLLSVATDAGLNNLVGRADTDYVTLMQNIVRDLEPTCTRVPAPDNTPRDMTFIHTCEAANGNEAVGYEIVTGGVLVKGPPNREALKNEAAKDSAWLAAKQTLARMER
ncbi:hypothetical protein ABNF97_13870 [Plantactinospora sp. B6F1]|uniref:hypothetical protein n=1 Tax=Plantactinospora sp. B6F1 TaxID=3158971 RepID=UPI0032D8B819